MLDRRQLLTLAGPGLAMIGTSVAEGQLTPGRSANQGGDTKIFSVRSYGATGDGSTIDSPAINRAIEAAEAVGGGTVYIPSGTYLCYSIRLKSYVSLCFDQGATIVAATPTGGASGSGYDVAETQGPWEQYQDYGHNHWRNSLIWGENAHDISIVGPGLVWGKGLNRGEYGGPQSPESVGEGAGNKAIALKNCYNITLRDFSILQGGWFGVLATGVDNLTIDNIRVDTNRDGMDIDCCRNVRISNCTVNSPWDDGICPKSSLALGYARPTENVTITSCFVTGSYEMGSVLNGTWKRMPQEQTSGIGRIKCGTESNGGFRNITISNCVFEHSRGFALETVDGAICEDITFTGITMRGSINSPMFLRLGSRMRAPSGTHIGTLRRVILSNITSSDAVQLPSILSGVPGCPIEDVKISDVYLHQVGGGDMPTSESQPPEREKEYPEPTMFGPLPATGFFFRHVKNLEVSNVEIAASAPDSRPAFYLSDIDGADLFRIRVPRSSMSHAVSLARVSEFRVFGSQFVPDASFANASNEVIG